jgi:hypothetical protein
MSTTMQEDARGLIYPKWESLKSLVKRVTRADNQWETSLEYVFENGDELSLISTSPQGCSLPAYNGFELLRVEVPNDVGDIDGLDFGSLVSRETIVGWLFERWRTPGLPITRLSGIVDPEEFAVGGRFKCIKHPDGRIERMGPSRYDTLGMRKVPASSLVADEAVWLANIKAEYLAYLERLRAFDTGWDAEGSAVCQALFGGCPRCGQYRILNIRSSHWGFCDAHKTKWPIGSDIVPDWLDEPEAHRREGADYVYETRFRIACKTIPDWRDETEREWQANADHLAEYTEVESLAPVAVIPEPVSQPT